MLSFKEPNDKTAEALAKYDSLDTNNKPFTGAYPPVKETDLGFPHPQKDFYWSATEEPHTVRRRLILQKHPEIAELYGHCPRTKYTVAVSVAAQFLLAYYLKDKMWGLEYWIISYVIGATINHSLFLAIHEISHFLAFKSPFHNRLLGFIGNLPIGIPYTIAFRGYHMEHHTQQGNEVIDTDLPTKLEGKLFSSIPGKLFFTFFQILFYGAIYLI
jgi:sphingolipid delta-4 desaturase